MSILQGFDASAPEESMLVSPGNYEVVIEEAIEKESKAGNAMLALTFQIVNDCPQRGSKIWVNLNLGHDNERVVKFAYNELKRICKAISAPRILQSPADLTQRACVAKVVIEKRRDTGEDQNKIEAYIHPNDFSSEGGRLGAFSASSVQSQPPHPQSSAAQTNRTANNDSAPWG